MPRDLRDLQKGVTVPGDSGAPHDVIPPWMDRDRFNRGREFFQRHFPGILLSQYMAQLVGFSVSSILDVLLYTGKSSSAEQAMKRYISTVRRLMLWHDGDVWDVNSKAHRSVMTVRKMHRQVARAITKNQNGSSPRNEPCDYKDGCSNSGVRSDNGSDRIFISQYDMALTQAGFVGFALLHPEKFGIVCTIAELEDYIFFWRGIGYLHGIEDEYNVCSGNYAETCQIIAQIENEIVKPGVQNPPKGYEVSTTSFVEGVKMYMKDRYLVTKDAMFSFAYDLMHLPMYKISMGDWCRFIVMKWMVWLTERVPGLSGFAIRHLSAVLKRENPE